MKPVVGACRHGTLRRRSFEVLAFVSLITGSVGCDRSGGMAEEQLKVVGGSMDLGLSSTEVRARYAASPHDHLSLFESPPDAEQVKEVIVSTPYTFGADNSVLHVYLDREGRVDCVAFRTMDSSSVHPRQMPPDRGCVRGGERPLER